MEISLLSPSKGEFIHIDKNSIKSIKAKEEIKEKSEMMTKFRNFLN